MSYVQNPDISPERRAYLESIVEALDQAMSRKEADALPDMLSSTWGVKSNYVSTPSGPTTPIAPVEEQTEFDVILVGIKEPGVKVKVIQTIRPITGLGLKEGKDLVDTAPKPIATGVDRAKADEIKRIVEAVGGIVEIK